VRKKPRGWRTRKRGTPRQIGTKFPITERGSKSKLPKGLVPVIDPSGRGWRKFSAREWEKRIGVDYKVIYDWRPQIHFKVLRRGEVIARVPVSPKGTEAEARKKAIEKVKRIIAEDRLKRIGLRLYNITYIDKRGTLRKKAVVAADARRARLAIKRKEREKIREIVNIQKLRKGEFV